MHASLSCQKKRVIYIQMGRKLFPKGMPAPAVIWDQIQLAQLSTTVYAMLPVLGEFFIEEGYTRYDATKGRNQRGQNNGVFFSGMNRRA